MKIAVIGGGGREHAVIKKLKESPDCSEIIAIPGNGGIAQDAACFAADLRDVAGVVQLCRQQKVDYVVVTPDDPLALGTVDLLAAAGIPAFGPTAMAARIESSKVFAKDLMQKYDIPTAAFRVFSDSAAAMDYIRVQNKYPVVIKADGLALGKGVLICEDKEQARAAVEDIIDHRRFGDSGARVVVEEFLTGPEVSVLSFCDGETLVPMVSSMDHKRALDGDEGPNTGGMGAVAPNPCYTPEIARQCMQDIFLPTVRAMQAEGCPFKGCLYFGLMLTPDGPKVIEYNCRFGDPETQVVLPLLQGDLLAIMQAATNGTLRPEMVRFEDAACACVVMASGGYPDGYTKGFAITGLAEAETLPGVQVLHAGTALEGEELVTAGGRVLGVAAKALTLPGALENAYAAVGRIHFEGAHYRTDIGGQALQALPQY